MKYILDNLAYNEKVFVTSYPTYEDFKEIQLRNDIFLLVVCHDMSKDDAFLTRRTIINEFGESDKLIICFSEDRRFDELLELFERFFKQGRTRLLPEDIEIIYPEEGIYVS